MGTTISNVLCCDSACPKGCDNAVHSALSSGAAELIAADHYAKREIMKLEEELPKWRTIIDTGAPPGRPSCTTCMYTLCIFM